MPLENQLLRRVGALKVLTTRKHALTINAPMLGLRSQDMESGLQIRHNFRTNVLSNLNNSAGVARGHGDEDDEESL